MPTCAAAADWPMWRYDPQRTATSPQQLPAQLHLQWAREYPALTPAWPDQDKMPFDIAYEPVVCGHMLLLSSSRHDCVRCLDTRTGEEYVSIARIEAGKQSKLIPIFRGR